VTVYDLDCWSSSVGELARNLALGKTLLIAHRDITQKPLLRGEDYFMDRLLEKLKADGVSIDFAVLRQNVVKLNRQHCTDKVQNLDNVLKEYNAVILFGVSPSKLLIAKLRYKLRLMMPVVFLWNKSLSTISNLKNTIGHTFWQIAVNDYIATSSNIARGLRLRGIFRRIYLIKPVYECNYCSPLRNIGKLKRLKEGLPPTVKIVYIGSLKPKRFSLADVVNHFSNDEQRFYELNIYTATPVQEKTGRIGRVQVNIAKKILSDEEKCRVLSESHLVIVPRRGTTMDPSMTEMEAEYHGNIVFRI